MKAYKVFDKDWKCREFQFKVGVKYKHKGDVILCGSGFHACKELIDCFNYYGFDPNNKVAVVEMNGELIDGDDKSVCSDIEIIKEITWHDVLTMVNTGKNNTGSSNSGDGNSGDGNSGYGNSGYGNSGDRNSGDSNSGYRNSGDRNSGDRNSGDGNSGDRNSGDRNSGDWNSINHESGMFNSKESKYINIFNKKCLRDKWNNSEKPNFIFNIDTNIWVWFSDMSEDEKQKDKDAYLRGGYLKTFTYKEAWLNAYIAATKEDVELLGKLPNFDSRVFFEITGININQDEIQA